MGALRTTLGFAAVAAVAYALNVAVLRENLFTAQVMAPLAAGVGLGAIWLALRLWMLAGTSRAATLRDVNAVVASVAMLGICVTLFAFAKRHDREWDLTKEGRRELAPQTIQILQSLDEEIEVFGFFVKSGDALVDVAQDKTRRFLERCAAVSPMLTIAFIDPQREPEVVERMKVLRISEVGTLVLRSGVRQRELPLSDVTGRLDERQFTNALINVARDASPKVYYLTGHGERDLNSDDPKIGGLRFRLWLEKEAYEVVPFVIPVGERAIPRDCSVLVINGYENDVLPYEIEALDDYIANGGRIFVLIDPLIALSPAGLSVEQMRPWLKRRFGIRVNLDILVSQVTSGYQTLFVPDFSVLGKFAEGVDPSLEFRGSFNAQHPISRTLNKQVVLAWARTVTLAEELPEGVEASVVLRSTPDTWAEEDLAAVVQRRPIGPTEGEARGPVSVVVAASLPSPVKVGPGEARRDARIVVMGDSGITANEDISFAGNQHLLLNAVAWLAEQEELIAIRPPDDTDSPFILTLRQQRLVAWVAVLGTVQAIGAAGFVAYLWRRRFR